MQQANEKRTYDARLYDVICTGLLAPTETITAIVSASADQGGLVFGTGIINSQPITYYDGTVVPVGKVIQIEISGGTIGANDSLAAGVPNLMCTVRIRFTTSLSPNQIEATVLLLLRDQPL